MTSNDWSWAKGLSRENRLLLLDVLEDMRDELEINKNRPSIPLFRQVIRYEELFPVDGIDARYKYMRKRYKTAELLQDHGIVGNVRVPKGQSGFNTIMVFNGDVAIVGSLFEAVKSTFPSSTPNESGMASLRKRLRPFGVHLVVFAAGFSFATAITRRSPVLWSVTIFLLLTYAVSIRFVPRWKSNLQAVAQWSEIGAAIIALAGFVWLVTHTASHATP